MRSMTSGDVIEFSFYCKVCCDNITPKKCRTCKVKDILVEKLCLICFNERRKIMNDSDMYFKKCHGCGEKSFVLKFDKCSDKGVCIPCLETPVHCTICGCNAMFFNKLCVACYNRRERLLSNNPYYPLMCIK